MQDNYTCTYFLYRGIHLVVKDTSVTKHIVEIVITHGNDEYGGNCDGSLS